MPTCAELDKEIKALKALMEQTFSALVIELLAELALSEKKLLSYESEVEEAKRSAALISQEYEAIKSRHDNILAESKALRAANEELRNQNTALTKELSQLEQYSRVNNIEIRRVPNAAEEDLRNLIVDIGSKVDCSVLSTDIDTVYRVPTQNSPKANNIIVRFASRVKKNEFQKKDKKARLTVKDIGKGTETTQVFFNDYLSPKNTSLFSDA